MTKLRTPLSFEDGITRIAGLLGWGAAAAQVIGQRERCLRNYSDPDTSPTISLADALKLDLAYRLAGGEGGTPMFDSYALQIDVATRQIDASADELARRTAVAAKEGGEAIASLIAANRPGATAAERAIAAREVREGLDAFRDTLPMLEESAAPPAGGRDPSAGGP